MGLIYHLQSHSPPYTSSEVQWEVSIVLEKWVNQVFYQKDTLSNIVERTPGTDKNLWSSRLTKRHPLSGFLPFGKIVETSCSITVIIHICQSCFLPMYTQNSLRNAPRSAMTKEHCHSDPQKQTGFFGDTSRFEPLPTVLVTDMYFTCRVHKTKHRILSLLTYRFQRVTMVTFSLPKFSASKLSPSYIIYDWQSLLSCEH